VLFKQIENGKVKQNKQNVKSANRKQYRNIVSEMDAKEFREFGRAALDFIADYLENIRDDEVLPAVEPGYLLDLLPTEMPDKPESWKEVLGDINRVIKPGLTHWQSPNMHAYYPTSTSYPSIVGEMLASGFGVIGFSWVGQIVGEISLLVHCFGRLNGRPLCAVGESESKNSTNRLPMHHFEESFHTNQSAIVMI